MNYFILILFSISISLSGTLQDAYDNALPANGYDKYLLLEPNSTYTGGVGIYEGDVYINCQGSTIDLEEGNGVWVFADEDYPSSLDIEYCTIANGLYYGISYGGESNGKVKNCNFINTNFGMKLFDFTNITVTNCIFAQNETYGIGVYSEHPTLDISYSLFWENIESDCMENCPGWGNIWTQLELDDSDGILYLNPEFVNTDLLDFNLQEYSPCIDAGNPNEPLDNNGSISDIGAKTFNNQSCIQTGDLNNDNLVNVLDVIDMINCILYSNNCDICYDVNIDTEYNVLDAIEIINLILN